MKSSSPGIYLIKLDGKKVFLLQHPSCQKLENYNFKNITVDGIQIRASIFCQNQGNLRWGEDGIYLHNLVSPARREKTYFKFIYPTNEL